MLRVIHDQKLSQNQRTHDIDTVDVEYIYRLYP